MSLNTAPIMKLPDIGKITDKPTRDALEQLLRFMFDNQRKIYDDLNGMRSAVILGDEGTDGSWKMVVNGNNLEFQRLESGTWVMKGTVYA